MGVQAGAVATKGVLGDACAAGHRERSGMAYGERVCQKYCPRRNLKASSLGSYPSSSNQRLVRQ